VAGGHPKSHSERRRVMGKTKFCKRCGEPAKFNSRTTIPGVGFIGAAERPPVPRIVPAWTCSGCGYVEEEKKQSD
jgi:ribosomal protein S27AE